MLWKGMVINMVKGIGHVAYNKNEIYKKRCDYVF